MTTYTNITKPSGTTYTNYNAVGKGQYDDIALLYDDTSTYYDSYNPNQYTSVSKPTATGQSWNEINGNWNDASQTWNYSGLSLYTNVNKPS